MDDLRRADPRVEGFCTCYPRGERSLLCGLSAHRIQAAAEAEIRRSSK